VSREVCGSCSDAVAAFQLLMNGPMGGVVTSLIGEAQESAETRSIVIELLGPYRGSGDDALGPILFAVFRRLIFH